MIFDLGLVRSIGYYTGAVFEVYDPTLGVPIGGGGRYDDLLGSFGAGRPAVGFALDVERLHIALAGEERGTGVVVAPAVMAMTGKSMTDWLDDLTIAVPRGALFEGTVELLASLGLDTTELRGNDRKLLFEDIGVITMRPSDVPTYVEDGAADLGITGKDVLLERGGRASDHGARERGRRQIYELLDLGYGRCTMVFATADRVNDRGEDPAAEALRRLGAMSVATKYPRIAARHLQETGRQGEIVEVKGSVELAPLTGLAEAIVDLTATGTTLRENGLVVREEIVECTARLIANPVAYKLKAAQIDQLLARLREQHRRRARPREPMRLQRLSIAQIDGLGGPLQAAAHLRSLVPARRERRGGRARDRGGRARTRRRRRAATTPRGFDTDGAAPRALLVPAEELDEALKLLDLELVAGLQVAIANVALVAQAGVSEDVAVELPQGQQVVLREVPVQAAAVYVPGGRAPYPSTVVMGVVTARAAGVIDVAVCAPPGRDGQIDPVILGACRLCGVERVYRMGGAQAIAALAYGTETVRRVDVIVGPGNLYVQEAKRSLSATVGIDGFAGPSDLLVVLGEDAGAARGGAGGAGHARAGRARRRQPRHRDLTVGACARRARARRSSGSWSNIPRWPTRHVRSCTPANARAAIELAECDRARASAADRRRARGARADGALRRLRVRRRRVRGRRSATTSRAPTTCCRPAARRGSARRSRRDSFAGA